jgi:hypothetical protein
MSGTAGREPVAMTNRRPDDPPRLVDPDRVIRLERRRAAVDVDALGLQALARVAAGEAATTRRTRAMTAAKSTSGAPTRRP